MEWQIPKLSHKVFRMDLVFISITSMSAVPLSFADISEDSQTTQLSDLPYVFEPCVMTCKKDLHMLQLAGQKTL